MLSLGALAQEHVSSLVKPQSVMCISTQPFIHVV